MSLKGKAFVMGAFEHPLRDAPDTTTPQLHAECAKGALEDAGLTKDDIDGYFCAGDAPGFGGMSMIDYMGLTNCRHMDSTETGGSSYLVHVNHAAQAIAEGKVKVALITLAGRPRQMRMGGGGGRPGGGS
ncbi:MAG TPA: thiolase domain-containing protein, partial [Phenylobacterium sp.]